MTIVVEKLPDEPIITAIFSEPMNYVAEVPAMFARILEIRDTIQGSPKYYVIISMTGIRAGFTDIVFSLNEARKTGQRRNPAMPVSLHLVGQGDLFEMVASALGQRQYGGYTAPLHMSLDEAFAAVRAEISAQSEAKPAA